MAPLSRKRARTSSTNKNTKRQAQRKALVKVGRSFPEKISTTIRYVETVAISTALATGTIARYLFSANGCYDPNITSTGHQPLGFDQWMGIYNHYTVDSSTIRAIFYINGDTNSDAAFHVGIYDDDDASNTLTDNALAEGAGRKKHSVVCAQADAVTLYSRYKAKTIFGKADLSDTSLRGTSSTNPSEIHSWVLYAYNYGTTSDRIDCTVDIEYNVTFYERKDLVEN